MITEFVEKYMNGKPALEQFFSEKHPENYADIVKSVISIINPNSDYGLPDPEKIHTIDDGEYQGTLVYVIAECAYQPDTYWYVKVGYGSCSGCDTLESIRCYSYDDKPNSEQVKDYMTLALHIVQGIKKMGEDD